MRLEDVSEGGSGRVGFGEAATIPWFGTETVDEDEAAARTLGEWLETSAFEAVPERCGCLRNALVAAQKDLGLGEEVEREQRPEEEQRVSGTAPYLPVAALLPAGRAALAVIPPRAELGFRIFKWKVGVGDVADELSLLDDVCAGLPSGSKLRLDANGAWDRRRAERWLERCAERPVEFVEQPCSAGSPQDAARRRKEDDVLLGLAGDFPTPIALDESLIGEGDIERWLGVGWPGLFVVKPALIGDVEGALARLAKAKAAVVFSSALETAIGARAALRAAFAWRGETDSTGAPQARALGFGVWPLFADARYDGFYPAPFIRRDDVERIDAETLWTALN